MNWGEFKATGLVGLGSTVGVEGWLDDLAVETISRRAGKPAEGPNESLLPAGPPAEDKRSDLSPYLRYAILKEPCIAVEWLEWAASKGETIPHASLPDVLDALAARRLGWEVVGPALGARGDWLARLLPEWAAALPKEAPDDLEGAFRQGTLPERVAALVALRAKDPIRALKNVRAAWSSESPKSKVALLAAFEPEPHPGEYEWLEQRLKERALDVCRAAWRAVAGHEGSPAQEALESWRSQRTGVRLLSQLNSTFGLDTAAEEAIIALIRPPTFDRIWWDAETALQRTQIAEAYARAIERWGPRSRADDWVDRIKQDSPAPLLRVASAAARDRLLSETLDRPQKRDFAKALQNLCESHPRWGEAPSRIAIRRLVHSLSGRPMSAAALWRDHAVRVAYAIHPNTIPTALSQLQTLDMGPYANLIEGVMRVLSLRQRLLLP